MMKARWRWSRLIVLALLAGCSEPVDEPSPAASPGRPGHASEMQVSPTIDSESEALIAFLGDSLSEGMGVEEEESFPRIVEARLRASYSCQRR